MASAEALLCEACGRRFLRPTLDALMRVCDVCGHHNRMPVSLRLAHLLDPGWTSVDSESGEDAEIPDVYARSSYRERVAQARRTSGVQEAVVVTRGRLRGRPVVVACMDFGFLGGSLGSSAGEAFARACEVACRERRPLVSVCTSGGARMQEGIAALAQMGRCTAAVALVARSGLPYISVLADPCFGGVTASFATQADVLLAEPRARIGFAGGRVIHQVTHQVLPDGFQTAEFLLQHGMLDAVVPRRDLRDTVGTLLSALTSRAVSVARAQAWRAAG
jgi:acetyl-CoA carboxylase carboxyl transferase subunit beta